MKCEFSLTHYKECIELAKDKGYTIIRTKDYIPVLDYKRKDWDKVLLLRHDIDFSLEYAYELANIEYDLGVKSSYYLYLHSELYNALSPKSMGMIDSMSNMDHEIGLHYDSRYYLNSEREIMFDLIGVQRSWSQHWPASNHSLDRHDLISPNDTKLKYISDSGRNWREGCMCQHIGKENKLHISCHPEWWVSNGKDRWEAIHNMYENYEGNLARNIGEVRNMLSDYEKEVVNKNK